MNRVTGAPDSLRMTVEGYVAAVLALVLAAVAAAGALTLHALRRPAIEELRDL